MVNHRKRLWLPLLGATLALQVLAGCAPLKKWWGEAPEKPGVIQLPSTRTECEAPLRILEGDDRESEKTFECWAAQVNPLWSDVDGREKSVLTDQEIAVLIRKGVISAGNDPEALLRKIYSAKKVLGLGPTLTRESVDRWIDLLRTHRTRIRMMYAAFTGKLQRLSYSGVRAAARTVNEILQAMAWSMDSEQLVLLARELIEISNTDVRNALTPAARAGINLLNAVCPTFSAKDLWTSSEIGTCLVRAVDHFEMGAAWFDFIVHPGRHYLNEDIRAIRISLELLNKQFELWFRQKELSPVLTGRWIDLSRSLGVDPPTDILSALDLVNRFHKSSNGAEIHPTAISGLFSFLRRVQMNVLEALPYFLRALETNRCVNEDARTWTECVPKNLREIRDRSGVIDIAVRVANPRFGGAAVPFNGSRFSRVMLYHELSGKIIEAFDEDHDGKKDGLISAEARKDDNEVARLITVGLRGYEIVRGFMDNIMRKWRSEPTEPFSDERIVDLAGLARLITMAHDVLVQRTAEDRSALEGMIANLLNSFPGSAMFLDHMSVTAVIVLADSLTSFKDQYLETLPQVMVQTDGQERGTVLRTTLAAALPEILKKNFPRTYQSCLKFGFEASCGIALDGVLPSSSEKDDSAVFVNDLDILTIAAASIEGLLDTCDANGNELLSWNSMDGNDELDCGFIRIKDVLKRLIEVDVIHTSSGNRVLANLALEAINSTFITRVIGKVALVRGTKQYLMLHWPLFFLYDDASIGSMLGLVSDVMDSDKAKKARKQAKRARKAEEKEKKRRKNGEATG